MTACTILAILSFGFGRTKFDIKSIELGEGAEKKSEENGSTEEGKAEEKKDRSVPMFPSGLVLSKDVEKQEPFSFGVSQTGFGNLSSGFGSGAGFSFGSLKKDSEPENGETEVGKDGDEEEEAVKVDEKSEAVVEEGAFFSKKCKLFYKKEVQNGMVKLVITGIKLSGCLCGKRLGNHPPETDG